MLGTPALPSMGASMDPFTVKFVSGEGILPIPDKLKKIILNLEFIKMRDQMVESWLEEECDTQRNVFTLPRRRMAPVTDILQWVQCCGTLVGVLCRLFPQMVPELMVYQTTIIKCSKDFVGLAWVQYDRAYLR